MDTNLGDILTLCRPETLNGHFGKQYRLTRIFATCKHEVYMDDNEERHRAQLDKSAGGFYVYAISTS